MTKTHGVLLMLGIVLLAGGGYAAWLLGRAERASVVQARPAQAAQVASVASSSETQPAAPEVVQQGATPPPPLGSTIDVNPSGATIDASLIARTQPPPPGYVAYESDQYHFSFYHAPDARVTLYDEGGGASTLVLENFQRMRGFQVFIVPYSDSKITEARFKEDDPSGVRESVENTTLDGVPAVTFTSEDATLGPTREIWTIHDGYLYEITTFQGVGAWFTPIIESWKWL